MEAAFEVAEQDRDGLDALLVGQVLEALFLDLVHGGAAQALGFRLQIQIFQFGVRKLQKVLEFVCH